MKELTERGFVFFNVRSISFPCPSYLLPQNFDWEN